MHMISVDSVCIRCDVILLFVQVLQHCLSAKYMYMYTQMLQCIAVNCQQQQHMDVKIMQFSLTQYVARVCGVVSAISEALVV